MFADFLHLPTGKPGGIWENKDKTCDQYQIVISAHFHMPRPDCTTQEKEIQGGVERFLPRDAILAECVRRHSRRLSATVSNLVKFAIYVIINA
jgi:hypothetical protein